MGYKILIIDDNDLVRETLRDVLEGADFGVVDVADGNEGIRSYEAEQIDLVITDLLMPGKEGIETIIELLRMDPKVKIIAISGGGRKGNQQFLKMAKKLGAGRVLPKPFRPKALLEAVRDLLPND